MEDGARILGIDPGERRVGLAMSDPMRLIASALETLKWNGEDRTKVENRIAALVEEHHIVEIVVGLPRRTDGRPGPSEERARSFAEALSQRLTIPVVLRDERYTSVIAGRMLRESGTRTQRKDGAVDRMAAAIILQDYLESRRK